MQALAIVLMLAGVYLGFRWSFGYHVMRLDKEVRDVV